MTPDRKSRNAAVVLGSILSLLFSQSADAADRPDAFAGPLSINSAYESLSLPGNRSMGMLGLGLNQELGRHFSAGVQTWSAVKGEHGGFITIGLDGAGHMPLTDGLDIEGGLFVGAGGGHGENTLSGGGLMLRTYAQLTLDAGALGRIGAGVSHVKFPNGSIRSTQPMASYTLPLASTTGKGGSLPTPLPKRQVSILGSDVKVGSSSRNTGGTKQEEFRLVGMTFDNFIADEWYLRIEAAGGAGGNSAGYMQVLAGPGIQVPLCNRLDLDASVGIGGAGGGAVDTGGGLLYKASAGLQFFITKQLFAEASVGYLTSAEGSFKAVTPSLQLGSRFGGDRSGDSGSPIPLRVRMASQHYFKGSDNWRTQYGDQEIDNLGLQLDYFFSPAVYLTGEALAAYAGKAGAYMTGLFGAGVQQDMAPSIFFDGEGLLGVAGGGGIAVGSGAVWQGNVGIGYRIGREFSLMVTGGRIGAFDGNFKANVLGVSLGYGNR